MKNFLKAKFQHFVFLICGLSVFDASSQNNLEKRFNAVDHKNLQLNLYLDSIQYNTQEKMGILPYILKKNGGVYLEIGTGGDPIAQMLSKISKTSDVTLIASDIDEGVLKSLPARHPELQKYLEAKFGPKLTMMQLDATDMSVFEEESLDGINASSLIHEVVSYAGGFEGMNKFFSEAARTLKAGGILFYRDPESVFNSEAPVLLSLKNKNIRLFAHIFLYKFLDKRGSSLGRAERKFSLYKPEDVLFTVFKKNATHSTSLTYEEYLKEPSYDIDFSRNYVITLPCGLYRELARHYLTYLQHCNPLVYVKCVPDISSGQYGVNYLAHSTSKTFSSFLAQDNQSIKDGKIDLSQKIRLDQHIHDISQVLEFGVPLHFSSKRGQCKLRNTLQKYGLAPQSYIIPLNNEDCLLDYRVFGMLHDEIQAKIFDEFNGLLNEADIRHAQWLTREGEESYFYLSADELITAVLKLTQIEHVDESGNKKIFVLCPISAEHNRCIERMCYSELLRNSLEVVDDLGYEIDVRDGKRIIHFSKMPLDSALKICMDIVDRAPLNYKKLKAYIDSIKTKVA